MIDVFPVNLPQNARFVGMGWLSRARLHPSLRTLTGVHLVLDYCLLIE